MKRSVLKWAIGVIALIITVWLMGLLPKNLELRWGSPWGIVVFVPLLAVVNAVLGTVLRLFALPINCATLGLFGFVINALLFWLAGCATGARTGAGQPIGFLGSLIGSIVYTAISSPLSSLVKERQ